ncbi:MAG TPA: YidC/Oxa1 family membrane protein insertase [Patescibacteria group bacterium]|nr:YidC/Oxa1 family membrane protein insertase [Patescibacteria group bacterium]
MLGVIWHDFLYQPLFNLLIWIYNNWTEANLGWAVVYLTILLRLVLLPFTLISEKDRVKNEQVAKEIKRLNRELINDQVLKKEEIRRLLKQKKVKPWSKMVVLLIQILVLVLLYQVFLRGITGDKIMKILYPFIEFPGKINTNFYGFELGQSHDIVWPGFVALLLILEIYFHYRKQKIGLNKADLAYFLIFPLFSFFALWILPMVKSVFILTSILFSAIIHQFSTVFFRGAVAAEVVGENVKKAGDKVIDKISK